MRLLILSLALLVYTNSFSQKELKHNELPLLVKEDTIIIDKEVWIQSVESEINQRHRENVLNKKLGKMKDILRKKKGYEIEVQNLIVKMHSLEVERDSLLNIISANRHEVNSELELELKNLDVQLKKTKKQYFLLREKYRKVWRTMFFSVATNVILIVIIVAI